MTPASANPATWGRTSTRTIGGIAVTQFTQPPNQRLPWHVHENASICFVLAGSYSERIGAAEHECPPHSVVYKPPCERHADRFGPTGGTCLLMEITSARLATMEEDACPTTRPILARSAQLAAAGHRLYGEFSRPDAFSPLVVEGLMLEILGESARAQAGGSGAGQPAWLMRVRDLLHDCPDRPLTLSLVAREVGIHPAHLARTFRHHFRCSIGTYLRRLRIERASRELHTLGRGTHRENVLAPGDIPIFEIERGGDVTYHGPGQLVGYPIFLLRELERDLHLYLRNLEETLIQTVEAFGLPAGRRPSWTGVWNREADHKLASIGVAVKRWVTLHGFALNVSTDLSRFAAINPCGLEATVMASMSSLLGRAISLAEVKPVVEQKMAAVFGREFASAAA